MLRTAIATAFLFVVSCAHVPIESEDDARAAFREILEVGIGQAKPDVVRALIGPTYKQHNPRVPDGPEGVIGFVTKLSELPLEKRVGVKVIRVIVDGELVAGHTRYTRRGRVIGGFDIFRVREGRFVEHWDAGMSQPDETANGHGLLDGPTEVSGHDKTAANKQLVDELIRSGMIGADRELMRRSVATDVVQHDPRIADGVEGWVESLDAGELVHTRLHRVVGEGDFVMTQSEGKLAEREVVIYDLFRVEAGSVREHWTTWERVPKRMAHTNGML